MPKRETDSPKFHGAVVVIDTDTVDRARRTGHPRLLRNLLDGKQEGLRRTDQRRVSSMKRIQFFELASVEHVRSLKSETRVIFGNPSPGSWITSNPHMLPILEEIEKRAPLGVEHIQLDGICRYEAEIYNGTKSELAARRAKRVAQTENRQEREIAREFDKRKEEADKQERENNAWIAARYGM